MSTKITVVDADGRRELHDATSWTIDDDQRLTLIREDKPRSLGAPLGVVAVYREWRSVHRAHPQTKAD